MPSQNINGMIEFPQIPEFNTLIRA